MKIFSACLASLVVLALFPAAAPAQEDEDLGDEFELLEEDEEMLADEVKSASKRRQSIFDSPSAITVMTREDIQASGATSLVDLLRRVPGFDVYDMKPSFPLVGARALTESSNNLVLLLIDGREGNVELAGYPMWAALTIDIEEIERVEIIRGPGSTLYGANAFAAVINVTTVTDRPVSGGDVFVSGGETGYYRVFSRVRHDLRLGDGRLSFGAGLGSAGQNSPSDDRDEIAQVPYRTHGYVRYRLGQKLDLSLHGGASGGAGTIFMIVGDFRATELNHHFVMAQARIGLAENMDLHAQLYHSRIYSNFHFRSDFRLQELDLPNIPDFNMDANTVDAKLQVDYKVVESLQLIGGGNLRYSALESNKTIPSQYDEIRGAVFAHGQWSPWDVLQLTGGFRVDLNSVTKGGPALSPRAVVVYRPWEQQAFRLGYGLAFRKPSFAENQLHIHTQDTTIDDPIVDAFKRKFAESLGNEKLVNEKVHSIEAGWRGHFLDSRLRATVDLFYNIYQDMIYFKTDLVTHPFWRWDLSNSTLQYVNQAGAVDAFGGELELALSPIENLTLWVNLGLRRVTLRGVTEEQDESIPREPLLRANLGCRWNAPSGPVVDLALHYVSSYEMPLQDPIHLLEDPELVELGDEFLIVGRVGFRLDLGDERILEAGLAARVPLGPPFREYPGISLPETEQSLTASDFGGERLVRLVSFYIRGTL